MSIIILYQLNQPLCWSELLIGCSSLLGMIVHLGSYAGVSFFSRCLDDANVVLLGLLSLAGGLLMAAFAHTTLLMLLGKRVCVCVCVCPFSCVCVCVCVCVCA